VKKRALYFIIVLALVLCMAVPTTTPVMASIIDAAKHPIPLLPDIYRIGDTIYYEMRVSNPIGNNASNYLTRIWDTLPNGTVIEFLGTNETLIQAPGENATFYASYTVAATNVVWLPGPGYYGVTNNFEAEGVNSDGAGVYVHRTGVSQVIRPDSEVAIVGAPATVVSGQEVDLTITEENTGFDELTEPYVEVWRNGTLFATLEAPPDSGDVADPSVLNVGEIWSWTIEDISITETTTFVALGFGTDPLGDEVSYAADYLNERDEVTVTAIEGGISLEKYVSVDGGLNWEEADSAPGPSAIVGSDVKFKVQVCNNGSANLTNVVVDDTEFGFTGVATSLLVGACSNSSIVTVPAVAGLHYDLATVTAEADGVSVTASDPAYYTGLTPGIDIEKYVSVDGGVTWDPADSPPGQSVLAGKNVSFYVSICNNGAEPLTNISVTDTDFTFTGVAASLAVGACDNSSVVTVPAVAGQHYDLATVTAEADGVPLTASDPAYYTGLTPGVAIEKYVSVDGGITWDPADSAPGPSALVGKNVSFKVTVCNNGGANLTNVVVDDTEFDFTGVATSLLVGACSNSSIVTVAAVAGLHYDLATVTAETDGVPVTASDPAYYTGSTPTPAIEIKKYTNGEDAEEAPGPYIAIGNAVTWTYVVRNIGNVDLTSVSVTDDKLGVIDTISLLPVGATETRYRYGTAAAGQYANNATVIGYYGAAEVTDWDPSHYYGRPAVVGWETYPVNKVRVLLPWIGLLGAIIAGASLLVLKRRRTI
jgi:uncharacterized repeat protein (TIGR01451 family)